MNIVGVIPSRYSSTRVVGKALADICGKPMVWWVYQQFKKVRGISEIYVATDDERIVEECNKYGIKTVMTSSSHPTHLDRLAEFATKVEADFYLNVNGDEPLINPENIEKMIPKNVNPKEFYFANAITYIHNPVEIADTTKIKAVTDNDNNILFMSRLSIPYPKNSSDFKYKKHIGIQCFTKSAIEFYAVAKRGETEQIEDIVELRFLENGKDIKFVLVDAESFSVDTKKDLDRVRKIISEKTNG